MAGLRAAVGHSRPRETPLVHVGVSPHAPYSVSDPLFSATARYARDESLPIAVHIAESQAEMDLVCNASGPFAEALRGRGISVERRADSPIELLERTDVLASRPLLIHCVRATEPDVGRVLRHDCAIAHCPASNAKLGHGIAPLSDWLTRGVRVGLGSDSVAANNRMDLLDEGRLAMLMQRSRLQSFDALPAREILELATLGGARALGLDSRIGSLAVGKDADFAAFALDELADVPMHAPEDALVFAAGGRRALLTVVRGRELVRAGRVLRDMRGDVVAVRGAAERMGQGK
jgi:5-methylthioadenosine/S-adenosylhomocysteine deaminase